MARVSFLRGLSRLVVMAGVFALGRHAAAGPIYDVLPDSTIVAAYIERPSTSLPRKLAEPILRRVLPHDSDVERIFKLLPRLPGPLLIALTKAEPEPNVLVAADVANAAELDKLLSEQVLPLAGDLTKTKLTLETQGNVRRIMRGDGVVFSFAVRDGRAVGSSDRTIAAAWLQGEFPKKKWVSDTAVRNWIGGLPKGAKLRLLFNPAPLIKDLPVGRKNSPEALLREVLAPQDVRAIAGDVSWDRNSLSLDVCVAMADKAGGISRALTCAPHASRTLGMFPADFIAVGRIGWPSAAAFVNAGYAVLDRVDPDIGAEYREELVDFKNETSVDFEGDLLANLVGEIGYGVRVNFAKPNPIAWAVVCPLANPARFGTQIDALLKHFDVPVTRRQESGLDVRLSMLRVPFAFAVAGETFIIADSPITIGELASHSASAGLDRPRSKALNSCLDRLFSPNTACLMVDFEGLSNSLGAMMNVLGPARMLVSKGGVGVALTYTENRVKARVTWMVRGAGGRHEERESPGEEDAVVAAGDDEGPFDAVAAAMEGLMGSAEAARLQAKRTVSASNLRGLGMSFYMYAQNHGDKFPSDLGELLRLDMITVQMLTSPYDGMGPTGVADVGEKCAYIYRGAGLTTSDNPMEVLAAERSVVEEGANFLFLDGHTEFIREPEASELIAKIQAGEKSVRHTPRP